MEGYYSVSGISYPDKISAFKNCNSGQYPTWHFLEDLTALYNWTQEPMEDLYHWYFLRAQQIRKKYDRVLLLFSGGIDSIAMLRSFVDNNIPIDGVVTYGRFQLNNADKLLRNQEALHVAVPYVQSLKKKHNLKFEHYLLDDGDFYSVYNDDQWHRQTTSHMFSPEVNIISQIYKDPWIQNHCELGKTVLVRGVDKPRIIYENNQWKLVFLDVQCQTLHAPWRKSHDALNYEFFYWSSDLPQIMSKQAHLIKNFFQSWNTESVEFKQIFSRQNHLFSRKKYVEWIDPIIYSAYLSEKPGETRKYFSLGKSPWQNCWRKDDAFFASATDTQLTNWKNGVTELSKMVPGEYFNTTKDYDVAAFLEKGLVGIWAKDEYVLSTNIN